MIAQAELQPLLLNISKSELIEPAELERLLTKYRGRPELADPTAFIAVLVEQGLITNLQGKLLLEGKSRGFLVNNKYKLLELIAAGGMGAVYLCEHVLMHRLVAMKVLPRETNAAAGHVERFIREARAVASLDHPNIVKAFDLDRIGTAGNHCLILEYVDGPNLLSIVKKSGPLDIDRAVNYIVQTAEGLQNAHLSGWVHRDIKPHNILLNRQGTIKILDLGLARLFNTSESLTQQFDASKILGTADYIAPEQVTSCSEVDIRADIYSLGATFYFLLTGRPPFETGSTSEKLMWHQVRMPDPINRIRKDVPKGLSLVIEKMMAKDPNQRYQTPIEVAKALTPWLISLLPPPPDAEMPRFCPLVRKFLATLDSSRPSTGSYASLMSRSMVDLNVIESRPSRETAADSTAVDLSIVSWRGRAMESGTTSSTAMPSPSGGSRSGSHSGSFPVRPEEGTFAAGGFVQRNLFGLMVAGLVSIALTVGAIAAYQNNHPIAVPTTLSTKSVR